MDRQSLNLETELGTNFGFMNFGLCYVMVSFKLYQNFLDVLQKQ